MDTECGEGSRDVVRYGDHAVDDIGSGPNVIVLAVQTD